MWCGTSPPGKKSKGPGPTSVLWDLLLGIHAKHDLMNSLSEPVVLYSAMVPRSLYPKDFLPTGFLVIQAKSSNALMKPVGHEKTTEMVLGGYARVMKFLMTAILCLILLLLGVKVPWKEIITGIVKWVLK